MYHILHSGKRCKVNTFFKSLLKAPPPVPGPAGPFSAENCPQDSFPGAPNPLKARAFALWFVGYSWRYTPFQLSLRYREDPCARWLAIDTNFSGAGVFCEMGFAYRTGNQDTDEITRPVWPSS